MNEYGFKSLTIIADSEARNHMSLILQQGFGVTLKKDATIRSFLVEEMGLSNEYVDNRISTIFLHGKPVDDIGSAHLTGGSRLALSAAMPGLVGATMRRKGYYASLRNTITYRADKEMADEGQEVFQVKLFNLLMAELGPAFLAKGVLVSSLDLAAYLSRQPSAFWLGCSSILLDGMSVVPADLVSTLEQNDRGLIMLTIPDRPGREDRVLSLQMPS